MQKERYICVIWTSMTFEKNRVREGSFKLVIYLTRHYAGGQ